MPEFHLHYIDGSEFYDHRSIGDFDFKDYDEAIKEVKRDYFVGIPAKKIEIDDSSAEQIVIKYLDDKIESGFDFGISIEEIEPGEN